MENERPSSAFAIISLVCGIVALVCGCCGFCCCGGWLGVFLSVAAIVLGILSLNREEGDKGMAIAGIICGSVALIIAIAMILIGSFLPDVDSRTIENYVERIEEEL